MKVAHPRISIDPAVAFGRPVVTGTRVAVDLILEDLAAGRTVAEVIDALPAISEADVRAALAFAADVLSYKTAAAETARRNGNAIDVEDWFAEQASVAAE